MRTIIVSNGGGYTMEGPEGIDHLLARLESEVLDPRFEQFGNFIVTEDSALEEGQTQFFGNFVTYSHVFDIRSDDPDVVARLTAAIRANQQTPAYLAALEDEQERRGYWSARDAAEAAEREARRQERAGVAVQVVSLEPPPRAARRPVPVPAAQGSLL